MLIFYRLADIVRFCIQDDRKSVRACDKIFELVKGP